MLKLKIIYERIIQEVGDMDNITSYPYKSIHKYRYQFKTNSNLKIDVNFQSNFTEKELEYLKLNDFDITPYELYNVSYNIEGIDSQYKKSDYKELIRILKTVTNICLDFIKNDKIKALMFFATNKDLNKLYVTDNQKSMIYKVIILKQLSVLPKWTLKDVDMNEKFKGFVIFKNNKI